MSGSAALSAAIRRRGGVPEMSRPTSSPSNPNLNQITNERKNQININKANLQEPVNQQQNTRKLDNNSNFDINFNKMIIGNIMNKLLQIESSQNLNKDLNNKLQNVNNNISNMQSKINNLNNNDRFSKEINNLSIKNEDFLTLVNVVVDKINNLEKKIDELSEKKIILNENVLESDTESISVSEKLNNDTLNLINNSENEEIIESKEINQLDCSNENQKNDIVLDNKDNEVVTEMIENNNEVKPEKSTKKGKKEYSNKNRVKLSIENN